MGDSAGVGYIDGDIITSITIQEHDLLKLAFTFEKDGSRRLI